MAGAQVSKLSRVWPRESKRQNERRDETEGRAGRHHTHLNRLPKERNGAEAVFEG